MVRDTTDLSPPSKGFSPGFHSPSQHKASSKHYAAFYLILPIHQKLAKFYKLQGRGLQSQGRCHTSTEQVSLSLLSRLRRRKMASLPLHSTKRIFQSLSSLIPKLYLFNVWPHVVNAESDYRFCNLSHVPTSSHLPCVHPGHLRSSGSVGSHTQRGE